MARRPALLSVCTLFASLLGLVGAGRAADHRDAPALIGNPQADITDVYLFLNEETGGVVTIVNLHPDAGIDDGFVKKGLKIFYDTDGDAVEDILLTFKFGRLRGGDQRIVGKIKMHPDPDVGGKFVTGRTTPFGEEPIRISGDHGTHVFGGKADDPFFADADFIAGPAVCPPGTDSFAFQNVNSVVIEAQPGFFDSPVIGVWARTRKDQMARALISPLYIPPSKLNPSGDGSVSDLFNQTLAADQPEAFAQTVLDSLVIFNDLDTAREIADMILPDVLSLSRVEGRQWPNGRDLTDDVLDSHLTLLTGGIETKDCVRRGQGVLRDGFPYFGAPWGSVLADVLILRQEPASDSPLVTSLAAGDKVQVLDQSSDGAWSQVRTTRGLSGWVLSSGLLAAG